MSTLLAMIDKRIREYTKLIYENYQKFHKNFQKYTRNISNGHTRGRLKNKCNSIFFKSGYQPSADRSRSFFISRLFLFSAGLCLVMKRKFGLFCSKLQLDIYYVMIGIKFICLFNEYMCIYRLLSPKISKISKFWSWVHFEELKLSQRDIIQDMNSFWLIGI